MQKFLKTCLFVVMGLVIAVPTWANDCIYDQGVQAQVSCNDSCSQDYELPYGGRSFGDCPYGQMRRCDQQSRLGISINDKWTGCISSDDFICPNPRNHSKIMPKGAITARVSGRRLRHEYTFTDGDIYYEGVYSGIRDRIEHAFEMFDKRNNNFWCWVWTCPDDKPWISADGSECRDGCRKYGEQPVFEGAGVCGLCQGQNRINENGECVDRATDIEQAHEKLDKLILLAPEGHYEWCLVGKTAEDDYHYGYRYVKVKNSWYRLPDDFDGFDYLWLLPKVEEFIRNPDPARRVKRCGTSGSGSAASVDDDCKDKKDKKVGDACTGANAATATCQNVIMTRGGAAELKCVPTKCADMFYMVHTAAGRSQDWCHACRNVTGADKNCADATTGKLTCPANFKPEISTTGGTGDKCVADKKDDKKDEDKTGDQAGGAKSADGDNGDGDDQKPAPVDTRNECERGVAGYTNGCSARPGICMTVSDCDTLVRAATQTRLSAEIATKVKFRNAMRDKYADEKGSRWKNADGNFNTARLASDSIAGAVLGTAGGLLTHHLVKKNQTKKGFEDIKCTVAGETMADYGDEFVIGK